MHLPLGTDSIIAGEIAKMVGDIVDVAVAPPITYTISALNRPGNVRLQPDTFRILFADIVSSFVRSGFRKFFVVLGHGGPEMKAALVSAAEDLQAESGKGLVHVSISHIARVVSEVGRIDTKVDKHAGDWETSLMLALAPDCVAEGRVREALRSNQYGVSGDPTAATKEKGQRLVRLVVEWISRHIEEKQSEPGLFCNWE